MIASIVPTASEVVTGATPFAGISCDSCTLPVTARVLPIESCQSIPESGTPKPFGFMTSSASSPETPPRPAEVIETSRTSAVGFSIECMNSEQPDMAARQARARDAWARYQQSPRRELTSRNLGGWAAPL